MLRKILSLTLLLMIPCLLVHGAFLDKEPSCRARGMGSAFTAIADDSSAVFFNPGGIAFLGGAQFQTLYTRLYNMDDLSYGVVNYVNPLGYNGKLGAYSINMQSFGFELYKENTIALSYGTRVSKSTGLGFNLKFMGVDIDTVGTASTIGLDVGMLHMLTKKIKLGLFFSNISQPKIGDEYLPRGITMGISYKLLPQLTLSCDIYQETPASTEAGTYGFTDLPDDIQQELEQVLNEDELDMYDDYLENFDAPKNVDPEIRFGMEYEINKYFQIRTGFRRLPDNYIRYSGGFSLMTGNVKVNYGFIDHPSLGETHAVSLIFGKDIGKFTVKSAAGKININTASKNELKSLPRIGEKTAEAIIKYREEHGGFKSIEEIMNVKRIGPKTFEGLKDKITVGGDEPTTSTTPTVTPSTPYTPSTPSYTPSGPVININTASSTELEKLPGIGPKKAQTIIDYRTSHGGFKSKEEIVNVKGIGPKTYEKLQNQITVE